MEDKWEFIAKLACKLASEDKTMTAQNLVDELNDKGYTTNYDTEFKQGRGIYTLIVSTYNYLADNKRKDEADHVAYRFTDNNKKPAWRFKESE